MRSLEALEEVEVVGRDTGVLPEAAPREVVDEVLVDVGAVLLQVDHGAGALVKPDPAGVGHASPETVGVVGAKVEGVTRVRGHRDVEGVRVVGDGALAHVRGEGLLLTLAHKVGRRNAVAGDNRLGRGTGREVPELGVAVGGEVPGIGHRGGAMLPLVVGVLGSREVCDVSL